MLSNNNKKLAELNADYRTFKAGDVIARCPDVEIGFIVRGTASCVVSSELNPESNTCTVLGVGDWLGLESFDCKCSLGFTTIWAAEEVCVVAFVAKEALKGLVSVEHWGSLLKSVLRQKAQIVHQTLIKDLPGNRRIDLVLTELSTMSGVQTSEGVLIPYVNRTELAKKAQVGREYTSRHLARLRQHGLIEMRNKGILLKKTLGE